MQELYRQLHFPTLLLHNNFRQTILYIGAEIKTFSPLSIKNPYTFLSRVDAAHACIVGHAVYGEHIGRRARVHVVLLCELHEFVETGDHHVL